MVTLVAETKSKQVTSDDRNITGEENEGQKVKKPSKRIRRYNIDPKKPGQPQDVNCLGQS